MAIDKKNVKESYEIFRIQSYNSGGLELRDIKQILNCCNPNLLYSVHHTDSCTKHPVFFPLIVGCNGAYSIQDQDSKDYNFGWKPYSKTENNILGKGERPIIHRGNIDP